MYVAAVTERRTWEVREKRCRQIQRSKKTPLMYAMQCNRLHPLTRRRKVLRPLEQDQRAPCFRGFVHCTESTPPSEIRHTGLMIAMNWQSVVSVRKATPLYSWLGTTEEL